MNRVQYLRRLQPAIDKMIDLLILSETKHCEGIKHRPTDALRAARHTLSSQLGECNPDGESHAVAALVGAAKVVLKEIEDDRS